MAGCRRPHGLHAHVVSALQPFRILSQAQRERGEYEIESGREREREREKLALLAFGRLAGKLSVGRSARCLSGWMAVCSTGRAPGCWRDPWPGRAPNRIVGWPAGCQPWMHGRLPGRLPICFPATPPSPSVEEPANSYAPLQLRCRHACLLSCLTMPSETGDCGNMTREREMHSSRIWPLGLGAWRCVRQVS